MEKKRLKTILMMTLLHISLISLVFITNPQLHSPQLSTVSFCILFSLVNFFYYSLAFSNPGYLLKPEELKALNQEQNLRFETVSRLNGEIPLSHDNSINKYIGLNEELDTSKQPDPIKPSQNYHHIEIEEENEESEADESDNEEESYGEDASASMNEINITVVRLCVSCQIEQPLRAKHCKECERCVALHDHHCPWIGVCIGEWNRRTFYFYLVFLMSL